MDLARTDRVAHADNRIGRILEGVFRVRPQAAREDHGVSREEDLFFRRHVVCADAVRFDALDAAAGVHVDAVGAQRRQHHVFAEHVLIRADLGQHLEDGDVAVVLRGDLGAAELQLAAELFSRTSTFRSRSCSLYHSTRRPINCIFIVFDFSPILVIGYDNSVIDEKYVTPVLNAESFSSFVFTGEDDAHQELQRLIAQLKQHYTSREVCYELTIKSILNAIWSLIYQQYTAQAATASTQGESKLIQRVKKALSFIYEHCGEPITLDEMAAACHTSKREFCRLFKASMHQTPFDFLLHYRIQKSLPLLCSSDLSVTEIAGSVGFSGSSYYSEVFRKFMQCSPTEYRKNNSSVQPTM